MLKDTKELLYGTIAVILFFTLLYSAMYMESSRRLKLHCEQAGCVFYEGDV